MITRPRRFDNTFKENSHLERAIMTGITRVSKESIFSDFNNLVVVTTSKRFETAFAFRGKEVLIGEKQMMFSI